ncbi:MAG TPA: hypothetical protein VIT00_04885 [Terrimicrobiaceae bacterium]|jgi:hypothetical protein
MATEKIKMRRGSARIVQHLAGAVLLGDGRMGVYIRTSLILVNVARCHTLALDNSATSNVRERGKGE